MATDKRHLSSIPEDLNTFHLGHTYQSQICVKNEIVSFSLIMVLCTQVMPIHLKNVVFLHA